MQPVVGDRRTEVQGGERREQEGDREDDPQVEEIDEPVERIAGTVLATS
jgi:hypothetical protein